MKILEEYDPFLKKNLPEYTGNYEDLKEPIKLMVKLMLVNRGIGLAANQVGLDHRLFLLKSNYDGQIYICINPEIISESSDTGTEMEGCLSYPGLFMPVKRSLVVKSTFTNLQGERVEKEWINIDARCFKHELDHLNGITFDTKVSREKLEYYKKKRKNVIKNIPVQETFSISGL